MAKADDTRKYLPLTESMVYIMLSLIEPLHGYAVMQKVEILSRGTVTVGPGTLYGIFTSFESEGLIAMVKEEERRKSYLLTAKGKTGAVPADRATGDHAQERRRYQKKFVRMEGARNGTNNPVEISLVLAVAGRQRGSLAGKYVP